MCRRGAEAWVRRVVDRGRPGHAHAAQRSPPKRPHARNVNLSKEPIQSERYARWSNVRGVSLFLSLSF